jgi:hypothetical protein
MAMRPGYYDDCRMSTTLVVLVPSVHAAARGAAQRLTDESRPRDDGRTMFAFFLS